MVFRIVNFLKLNKYKIILFITTVAVSALLLFAGNMIVYDRETMFLGGYDDGASTATVTEIIKVDRKQNTILETQETVNEDGNTIYVDKEVVIETVLVVFKCEITSGDLKGQTVTAYESISDHDFTAVKLKEVETGDKVLITRVPEDSVDGFGYGWHLYDYDRTLPLWILGGLFLALILIFGRRKGVNTAISLCFTIAAVFLVFVPSILSGYNTYVWSILTCIYIIAMSLLINEGYNKKTLAAVIGCASGVVVAGVLAVVTSHFLNLTGVTDESSMYLTDLNINLNALIFAGIILGAVGAVKDVSVSISSSLKELHEQVEKPTFGGLVKSGMIIGRDIMGTMADTLVLAYIGCELTATLLQVMYSSSLSTLFSREKIVAELLQALVGSIGILLAIPLTAVVSAALYVGLPKFKKKDKYYIEPAEEPSLYEKTGSESEDR